MALPRYYIPRDLENAIKDYGVFVEGSNVRNKFSQVLMKLKNVDCLEIAECHYLQFLKLGLYLEEYRKTIDTRKQFQIEGTKIERVPDSEEKFKIKVENLDETNPLLNVTDLLIAYEQYKKKIKYFFTVVKVSGDHVIVSANKKFCKMYSELTKYNIELKFNSYWFQCCHYALTTVDSFMISRYIFPQQGPIISQGLKRHHKWFNELLNPEQKQVIINVINKSSFPAPYILYGPPGTGKTSTLVEAICQLRKLSDDYILICAPSNAACDVLTKRLLDYIPHNNLYRLYSRTEEYSRINEDIKKCCNFKNSGKAGEIEHVDFSCKKIIITTLCTSVRLERVKLPFSYLFIDEGGQAALTDVLLPFCALKFSRSFQIVISGDHHQLGPCITSKFAEPLLGQSILEKLMKQDPYKKDAKTGYDPRYITKLTRNYRSSKDIIHVPNVLFYDNELIACNNTKLSAFPVVFYAVEGKERKMPNSKSSYNEEEMKVVLIIIKNIIGRRIGDKIIRKEDVGIVTPFRLQVSKIREKLDNSALEEVDVGTVEIFQGQEKELIIISTVRSETFIHDGVEHIGFLSNPKRFNVALTRAKSLLTVVGNPSVLQTNKYWRYFLRFCQENNSCKGDSFSLKNELTPSLHDLTSRSKIKKSTDLFNKSFTILKLDDGVLSQKNTSKNNYNQSKQPNTSNTNVSKSSINSVPSTAATAGSMNRPMRNINIVPKSTVLSGRNSSMRNLDSIRDSSMSINMGNSNIVRNSPLNAAGLYSTTNPNLKNINQIHGRKPVTQEKKGCFKCCCIL